jgi:peptidoglycan/xylan/chitin deacetylase (PgdA/CDA1 family)
LESNRVGRLRGTVKSALAATIARAHDRGLAAALARGPERPLVLGYHRVVEDFAAEARDEMPSMLIGREMFERHLDCIGRHYTFVSIDDIAGHFESGVPFTERVAAVTFDDGYRDVYENAIPLLTRKGIPAAMFVVTDLVGHPFWQIHDKLYHLFAKAFASWDDPRRELTALMRSLGLPVNELLGARTAARTPMLAVSAVLPGLPQADVQRLMAGIEHAVGNGFHRIPHSVTWEMLADMRRRGFTIGSHTRSHVSLPMESPERIADELEVSKRAIEERLGGPIEHFAYPGGQFTSEVVSAVAQAGYRYAYTACQHDVPAHPTLTIERLLLWEGSSVGGDGQFAPAILNCQAHDLWPPVRRCERVHHA